MIDFLEKTILAGFGALALTQKKSEELLKEIKERIDLSEDEGKQLLKHLQESAKENQQKLEELAREELQKAAARAGVVTKTDFDALAKKVARLEKQLKEKT